MEKDKIKSLKEMNKKEMDEWIEKVANNFVNVPGNLKKATGLSDKEFKASIKKSMIKSMKEQKLY